MESVLSKTNSTQNYSTNATSLYESKVGWASKKAFQAFEWYFGFQRHSRRLIQGVQIAPQALTEKNPSELVYGTTRIAMGSISLFKSATYIGSFGINALSNSRVLGVSSIGGLINHHLNFGDGTVAGARLSWLLWASKDDVSKLTEAQLQRRLGDDPETVQLINQFKAEGTNELFNKIRAKAKENIQFRSLQVSIAGFSLASFYSGSGPLKLLATGLTYLLYSSDAARHINANRPYYTQLAADALSTTGNLVKKVANAVFIETPKKIVANVDWFFEFSASFQAANEARKRGDWQEVFHASLRIFTSTLILLKYPGNILANLNPYLNLFDAAASSGLFMSLSVVGLIINAYSFFEGLISSARLAWMMRATNKQMEEFSEHQLTKRLGPSYKEDIALFNKISQVPEDKRTAFDRMALEKLVPDMRAQAKRKLCIRILQSAVAALSIAAIVCTFLVIPYIAIPLMILAIGLMILQIILDGAWAENRGNFSLLNFLPDTQQKDFEVMTRDELIKCLGEGFTDKVDLFKKYIEQKSEIGLMNLVPDMQQLAKQRQMVSILFKASVVGAILGVVAVAIGAFPIAIGLAVTAALLLALYLTLNHAWTKPKLTTKQLHGEAASREPYPWLQEALQSMHKRAQ